MPNLNLLDIARLNGSDAMIGLLEENLNAAPEVTALPARTIRGTSYRTMIRTSYPSVGFRKVNEGDTPTKSTFDNRLVECFVLSSLITVDKAAAMAYEGGSDALKALEASGVMEAALQSVGRQIIYGTNGTYNGDADGFPGLLQCHDSTNMVVDAGGTTASTGSSAWLLATGMQGVQLAVGQEGRMELGDWREELVSNVPSFVADLTAWVGLQVANSNKTIGRIKKLTEDSAKGLTDALLARAYALFPVGKKPNLILVSRRSHRQLWTSRTVTLFGGPGRQQPEGALGLIAPPPTEFNGIPIVVTDSIGDTEALTL